jgi:tRNA(Arg) A34 adenosine deaminase TadA
MKRLKNILLFVALGMILCLLLLVLAINYSSIRPGIILKETHLDSLLTLQDQAAQMGEYPVSALVVYKDSIIGAGYNTFRNRNEPMGHAEINAIEDVFKSMHYSEFRALSRDSLMLITSYEPCPMCKGVINHLDIRKVYYLKAKSFRYRFKYVWGDLRFYARIKRIKVPKNQ